MKSIINLPELNNQIVVPEDNLKEFSVKGHTLLKSVLSADEVAACRQVIIDTTYQYNTETRSIADRDTYGKAFLQVMNLWQHNEDVKKYVLDKRMARIAADLLGVENVRIYHDQALFKEPGGGPTPWHQDQYYWPIDTHNTVTLWMPLIDIDQQMGMLTFASGSFTEGAIFDHEISDQSDTAFEDYISEKQFTITAAKVMKAGDATFHRGFTIHKAPGNYSEKVREVMTIIYVADGARVIQPANKAQQNDLERWLMNKPVGELINSELNPALL